MSFREELQPIADQFLAAFSREDAAACADFYTEDAHFLECGKEPVRGRAAIKALFADAMASGLVLSSLTILEAHSDNDLGYAINVAESNEGNETAMLVLKRDEDGIWRVCAEAVLAT